MNARRLYGPVVLATLAVGGLTFLAAGRTWAHVKVATDGLPSDTVDVTGSDAQPLLSALALVIVTTALAILAASPRVRRVVGVFTVLVALAGAVILLSGGSALDDAVKKAVEASPAYTGAKEPDFATSAWKYVALLGFLLAAALGAVTARFGPIWPTMSSRYDAPKAHPDPAVIESDADMWKALDEGRDPTK